MMFTDEQFALFTEQLRTVLSILEHCTPEQINALKETNEKERTKEKDKKENSSSPSWHTMNEEEKEEGEEDLIFMLSCFYLSEGYANSYAEARSIWQYNNSLNWRTRDGRLIENREAWLKRAVPKSGKLFLPQHGRLLATILEAMRSNGCKYFLPDEEPLIINTFRGMQMVNDTVLLLFSSAPALNTMHRICRENPGAVNTISAHLRSSFPEMQRISFSKP